MRTTQLLAALRERGVELWTEGSELRFRAPPDALTPELLADMREQKAAIRAFIERAQKPAEASQAIRVQTKGAGSPLFFMHEERSALLSRFGTARPVYAIGNIVEKEILAWSRGETVGATFEDLAGRFVAEMRRVQPHGPYYLAGYCLYALLALEAANQLRRQGEEVGGLFVLDAYYHAGIRRNPIISAVRWAHRLRYYILQNHGALKEQLHKKSQLKRLRRELPPTDLAYLNRIHFWSHIAKPYRSAAYDGRVVLLRAMKPRYPNPFGMRRDGWDRLLTGEVHREDFACNHDDIVWDPFAKEMAERMERHMARIDGAMRGGQKVVSREASNGVGHAKVGADSGDMGRAPVPA